MKSICLIIALIAALIISGCASTPSRVTPRAEVSSAQWLQAALNHANTMISDVQLPPMDRNLTLDDYSISIANVSIQDQRTLVVRFELRDKKLYVGLGFPQSFTICVNENGELNAF